MTIIHQLMMDLISKIILHKILFVLIKGPAAIYAYDYRKNFSKYGVVISSNRMPSAL